MADMTVAEIMTTPVLTASEDWTIEQLARFFIDNGVSGAPVTNQRGEAIGVVSITDIVRHDTVPVQEGQVRDTHEYFLASSGRQYSDEEMQGFRIEASSSVTTRDVMTPMVFSVAEDTRVQEVADMMVRGGIHRVIVTNDRKVRGIVTALDMLTIVRDL